MLFRSPFAAFVLDGIGHLGAVTLAMEFNDIGFSGQPQLPRLKQNPVNRPNARRSLHVHHPIRPLVAMDALDGVDIVHPQLLDPMQGAAALAEEEIVEGADG